MLSNPQIKSMQFIIRGMQRDLSVSKFNANYAYENMNMRIAPIKENTMASMTNEKGNEYSIVTGIGGLEYEAKLRKWYNYICPYDLYKDTFYGDDNTNSGIREKVEKPELESGDIIGVPIGQNLLGNELTLFTTELEPEYDIEVNEREFPDFEFKDGVINDFSIPNKTDRIYKLWLNNGRLNGKLLYKGHLNFDYRNPIETIGFHENSSIRKVYWTDGINQPRFINIAATDEKMAYWNNKSFDFVRTLRLEEEVTIKRSLVGGLFPAGCVQYAFTYCNLFGAESNIFYISTLNYTSFEKRGASPEDVTSNSFNIVIKNLDINFDYVRIYSIVRTSIDNVPTVKLVASIPMPTEKIDGTYQIDYTDTNTNGSIVDPTEMFYVGGEIINAYTFAQKDNTLFLGNVNLKRQYVNKNLRDNIRAYAMNTKIGSDIYKKGYINDTKNSRLEFYNNNDKRITLDKWVDPYDIDETAIDFDFSSDNRIVNKHYLNLQSARTRYFQKGEIYRFGLQFKHYTGKWSDVVWVGDYKNTLISDRVGYKEERDDGYYWYISGTRAKLDLSDIKTSINSLIAMGYREVRPVVVYPTINERLNIAQGILNPTLFGLKDRIEEVKYAKPSYFFRPFLNDKFTKNGYPLADSSWGSFRRFSHLNTVAGVNNNGASEGGRNAELDTKPYTNKDNYSLPMIWEDDNEIAEDYMNYPVIDQHIVTFNSPDLEFDTDIWHMDLSNIKLAIIGQVEFKCSYSDIDITTFNTPNAWWKDEKVGKDKYAKIMRSQFLPDGFWHKKIHSSYHGASLLSSYCWIDNIEDLAVDEESSEDVKPILEDAWKRIKDNFYSYLVCPWQQTGSLNNSKTSENADVSSKLKSKKLSTLFTSNTEYFENDIWVNTPAEMQLWTSDQDIMTKLNGNIYRGNVDELIMGDSSYSRNIVEIDRSGYVNSYRYGDSMYYSNGYTKISDIEFEDGECVTSSKTSTNPISMKYKSNVHMAIDLGVGKGEFLNKKIILPTVYGFGRVEDSKLILGNEYGKYDDTKYYEEYHSDNLTGLFTPKDSFLYLAKLYRDEDTIKNRFGGITDEALQNNKFVPCGESVKLYKYQYDENGDIIRDQDGEAELRAADSIIVKWIEGDVYFQNYQCLKTYPFTLEDENSVVEILNFDVETRINLAGRYDRNMYEDSNLVAMPTNFNLINNVYSQKNNFFTYSQQDLNMTSVDDFPNVITWTKTKIAGDEIDQWTNITMASTLDLDGDKGNINKLVRLNDQIISFQDRGISQILYNEQMQMSTTQGVPIEIANSGKVSGKRYMSEYIGCQNKWSICLTPKGCYFIDDINKGIFSFSQEGLRNMSNELGFHSWINNESDNILPWNPVTFNNIVSYYDKKNEDVLFITDEECLAYSEQIGQFTSFYSYEKTPYYSPLEDRAIMIKNMCHCGYINTYKIWFQHEGDYNMYFGNYRPFYTTFIANQEMQVDKVFNNLEFRSDTWRKDGVLLEDTFDTLTTWDEYQKNTQTLLYNQGVGSTLKKKFRIWYTQIPRDRTHILDRMRNPWLWLKLGMSEVNTNKTTLHDMKVYYYG